MLDLASRTVSILTNEASRDELSYARSAGATIIHPGAASGARPFGESGAEAAPTAAESNAASSSES